MNKLINPIAITECKKAHIQLGGGGHVLGGGGGAKGGGERIVLAVQSQ
jgi:hypothetical protein